MARNRDEEEGKQGKTAIERVIEHHQLRTHEARSRVLQTQHVLTNVPRQPRLRLQQEILDYYYAMKPLRDRSEVEDWWDNVTLSENWVKGENIVQNVTGDVQSGVKIEEEVEQVYYEGLDEIPDQLTEVEVDTVYEHGLSGPSTTNKRQRKVLPADVLIDLATVLDDAAMKLGFGPEGEAPVADPMDNVVDPRGEER